MYKYCTIYTTIEIYLVLWYRWAVVEDRNPLRGNTGIRIAVNTHMTPGRAGTENNLGLPSDTITVTQNILYWNA